MDESKESKTPEMNESKPPDIKDFRLKVIVTLVVMLIVGAIFYWPSSDDDSDKPDPSKISEIEAKEICIQRIDEFYADNRPGYFYKVHRFLGYAGGDIGGDWMIRFTVSERSTNIVPWSEITCTCYMPVKRQYKEPYDIRNIRNFTVD